MRVVTGEEIERLLDYPYLVAAIGAAFAGAVVAPPATTIAFRGRAPKRASS
jgi:hypothetical protein